MLFGELVACAGLEKRAHLLPSGEGLRASGTLLGPLTTLELTLRNGEYDSVSLPRQNLDLGLREHSWRGLSPRFQRLPCIFLTFTLRVGESSGKRRSSSW